MTGFKKFLCVWAAVVCGALFSGCGSKGLIDSVQINTLSGNPDISVSEKSITAKIRDGDAAELCFSQSGLEADEFYVAQVELSRENSIYAAIKGSSEDINSDSVTAEFGQTKKAVRIVKSDSEGSCDFKIVLKNDKSDAEKVKITSVSLAPASESEKYSIYSSSDKTVKIIFRTDDVKNSGCSDKAIKNWLDNLARIRKTLDELSQNSLDCVYFCATESFGHYGLSGNPVYINREYVTEDLQSIEETREKTKAEQEILWGYVHEMAHMADGFGFEKINDRVFDSEFSAQLECAYAIAVNGFRYPDGKTAIQFFSENTGLARGLYSDEGFLLRLLEILEECDPHMDGLKSALLSEKYTSEMTSEEKLNVFFDELSEYTDTDIRGCFTQLELSTIQNKFKE